MITAASPSELLYKPKPYKLFPVGQGQVVIYLPEDDRAVLTPYRTARLLPLCTAYRTIQEHVAKVGRSIGVNVDRLGAVSEALTTLIEAGVIQKKLDWSVHPIAAGDQRHAGARISAVAVLTAERPAQMLRCVESLARNVNDSGRAVEIIVMNDSRRLDYAEYLGRLGTYARAYSVDVRYASRQHRAQFCEALAMSRVPFDVCRHALLGFPDTPCSIGATRNAILLETSGYPIMMLDDDMVCRFSLHPQHATGCRFAGHTDPTDIWTLCDPTAALPPLCSGQRDLLAEHELLLGKCLSELYASDGAVSPHVDDDACDHMLAALQSGNGRVVLTMAGVLGDSGTYSNFHLLTSKGETRTRLLHSQELYRSALSSREILRVARRATVTDDPGCMAGNLGLENTMVVPPFIPNFRGEDRVFGALFMKCVTDAYYGHIPIALFHAGDDNRETQSFLASCVVGMADVYFAALGSLALPDSAEDPSARLELIARHLKHLGALKPDLFIRDIRSALLSAWSARLTNIQNALDDHDDWPSFWLNDLAKVRHQLIEVMTAKDFWVPRELANTGSLSDIQQLVQRAVYLFGELCEWWPDIVRASRERAEKGSRMSATIVPSPPP
jgi:hypothetical protein